MNDTSFGSMSRTHDMIIYDAGQAFEYL